MREKEEKKGSNYSGAFLSIAFLLLWQYQPPKKTQYINLRSDYVHVREH